MTAYRISVIIRCHQQGRFLTGAVASVRAQSRAANEIIVVDDGSSDETADVLKTLLEGGPLLTLRHDEPLGPAKSLNAGVLSSSGELVLVLDADDALSPAYLELTEQAIVSGADMAYGAVERFGAESSFSPARPFSAYELGVENFIHVSTLFRRSLFDAIGGFRSELDQLGLEDWAFWLSAVEHGAAVQAVEHCWLRYRRHPEGSRNTMRRKAVLKVHLRMHLLHPATVSWAHLARWIVRSVRRNLRVTIILRHLRLAIVNRRLGSRHTASVSLRVPKNGSVARASVELTTVACSR